MAKTPMTTRGAELLRVELHRLKSVERVRSVRFVSNGISMQSWRALGTRNVGDILGNDW